MQGRVASLPTATVTFGRGSGNFGLGNPGDPDEPEVAPAPIADGAEDVEAKITAIGEQNFSQNNIVEAELEVRPRSGRKLRAAIKRNDECLIHF